MEGYKHRNNFSTFLVGLISERQLSNEGQGRGRGQGHGQGQTV
jgi:hypothetical protein